MTDKSSHILGGSNLLSKQRSSLIQNPRGFSKQRVSEIHQNFQSVKNKQRVSIGLNTSSLWDKNSKKQRSSKDDSEVFDQKELYPNLDGMGQ